jgi:MoaD family protein
MNMRIEYFATFRIITGCAYEELPVNGASILEVLESICIRHPDLKQELFIDDKLREGNKILLNGRDIRALDGLTTVVHDNDEISLFSAVGGG